MTTLGAAALGMVNAALNRLGTAKIASLDEPTDTPEIECADEYPKARAYVMLALKLQTHRAVKTITPTVAPADVLLQAEAYGRAAAFAWPATALSVVRRDDDDFEVVGRYLYGDGDTLEAEFNMAPDDPLDELVARCVELELAKRLCERLSQNSSLGEEIKAELQDAMRLARRHHAKMAPPSRYQDSDVGFDWLHGR